MIGAPPPFEGPGNTGVEMVVTPTKRAAIMVNRYFFMESPPYSDVFIVSNKNVLSRMKFFVSSYSSRR
jgi:hypothetical protein